jgi:hypothetical protein
MTADARARLVKQKRSGEDPLVDKILTEGSPELSFYEKALKINKSGLKRSYLESCLLASQDVKRISGLLGMPVELVVFYKDVFYDVWDLDKLSKLELVDVTDKNESLMKLWALNQGLDFIAWRLGEPVNINPTAGLQDLFSTCIMKSKEAMFSGNATAESSEATKWVKLSMDIARLLRNWVMDSEGARKDIELALRETNPDFDGFDSLPGFNS